MTPLLARALPTLLSRGGAGGLEAAAPHTQVRQRSRRMPSVKKTIVNLPLFYLISNLFLQPFSKNLISYFGSMPISCWLNPICTGVFYF
jgi:hypothetical protein